MMGLRTTELILRMPLPSVLMTEAVLKTCCATKSASLPCTV